MDDVSKKSIVSLFQVIDLIHVTTENEGCHSREHVNVSDSKTRTLVANSRRSLSRRYAVPLKRLHISFLLRDMERKVDHSAILRISRNFVVFRLDNKALKVPWAKVHCDLHALRHRLILYEIQFVGMLIFIVYHVRLSLYFNLHICEDSFIQNFYNSKIFYWSVSVSLEKTFMNIHLE